MKQNSSEVRSGRRSSPPALGEAESVEQVRKQVDRLCWSGILLGLAFTMTNVQGFAAAGAPAWTLVWWAAWLLDPMVSLVLLAILRAEQVTARYGVRTGGWVRAAKWFTLAATYVMNTWQAFAHRSADLAVLHSVPPLVVFVAAEAVTDLRDKLSEAVHAAFANAEAEPADVSKVLGKAQPTLGSTPVRRRVTFDEYLARAREQWEPHVVISPAWIRQATGCSRGLSSRLSAALEVEIADREGQA